MCYCMNIRRKEGLWRSLWESAQRSCISWEWDSRIAIARAGIQSGKTIRGMPQIRQQHSIGLFGCGPSIGLADGAPLSPRRSLREGRSGALFPDSRERRKRGGGSSI